MMVTNDDAASAAGGSDNDDNRWSTTGITKIANQFRAAWNTTGEFIVLIAPLKSAT